VRCAVPRLHVAVDARSVARKLCACNLLFVKPAVITVLQLFMSVHAPPPRTPEHWEKSRDSPRGPAPNFLPLPPLLLSSIVPFAGCGCPPPHNSPPPPIR